MCVSLFYVNDIGSTGSRGRTMRGIPCVTRPGPLLDRDRVSLVGSPLESGVSPAHIGPSNACPRAAPETTPLWRLFLINLSLSVSCRRRSGSSVSPVGSPLESGVSPAHIGPSNACHQRRSQEKVSPANHWYNQSLSKVLTSGRYVIFLVQIYENPLDIWRCAAGRLVPHDLLCPQA